MDPSPHIRSSRTYCEPAHGEMRSGERATSQRQHVGHRYQGCTALGHSEASAGRRRGTNWALASKSSATYHIYHSRAHIEPAALPSVSTSCPILPFGQTRCRSLTSGRRPLCSDALPHGAGGNCKNPLEPCRGPLLCQCCTAPSARGNNAVSVHVLLSCPSHLRRI